MPCFYEARRIGMNEDKGVTMAIKAKGIEVIAIGFGYVRGNLYYKDY